MCGLQVYEVSPGDIDRSLQLAMEMQCRKIEADAAVENTSWSKKDKELWTKWKLVRSPR